MVKSFRLYRDPVFLFFVVVSFFFLNTLVLADGPLSELTGTVTVNETPVPNAVVYLMPEKEGTLSVEPIEYTIKQKELAFLPAFSVVTVGSTVYFENNDDKIHNVRSNGPSNRFNLGTHLPETTKQVVLKNPGIVSVQCNVHPEMSAIIYVSPSPYAAVTNDAGRFKIRKIQPGKYTLVPWHQSLSRKEIAEGRRKINIEKAKETLSLGLMAMGGLDKDFTALTKIDWFSEVDEIASALETAFSRWKKKRHTSAATKVMRTYSVLYQESGLRKAIAKSLGEPRALELETRFDDIRKSVQGVKKGISASEIKQGIHALVSDLKKDAETIKGF